MTLSICSGNAPSSTIRFISVPNGVRLRLATNPSQLPAIALTLADLAPERHRQRIGCALRAFHDLKQLNDIGRRLQPHRPSRTKRPEAPKAALVASMWSPDCHKLYACGCFEAGHRCINNSLLHRNNEWLALVRKQEVDRLGPLRWTGVTYGVDALVRI
jgi:hypothetical protein